MLALFGGDPVRATNLPYGRAWISEADIAEVIAVLKSDWLTTGPRIPEFEAALCAASGAEHVVAVNSGTAALHAAMFALDVGPGDEVIVPSLTFAATANCVVYQGGTPVFVDIRPDTLLIDPELVEQAITERTKAVIAVDYAGQPCDYDALAAICRRHGIALVADACHSIGGSYKGRAVGTLADITCFSFHPVKHITTAEGGAVATANEHYASRARRFRNHGITTDHRERERAGSWFYEMTDLGYNYRLSDLQCALGTSQLRHLPAWVRRRQEIASIYDEQFAGRTELIPVASASDRAHARHLYVIRIRSQSRALDRATVFRALRAEGIGVNVHYIPVHLHPFYQQRLGTCTDMLPLTERAYKEIVSLPIFPAMTPADINDVITAVLKVVDGLAQGAASAREVPAE